jgi:PIN domain nuclease of toxin-antitoxin system
VNLLDTHVLAWAINEPERLSLSARRIIEDGNYTVSCASLWEMIIKKGRSTALIDDPLPWWKTYISPLGKKVLSIEPTHVQYLDILPGPIRDPIDRILMSQCIINGLRLVTKDAVIRDHYQDHVNIVW